MRTDKGRSGCLANGLTKTNSLMLQSWDEACLWRLIADDGRMALCGSLICRLNKILIPVQETILEL